MSHEHPLLSRLGATVRALRAGKRWSRRDLADRAGISERFLADVESGTANPSILRLDALATALGVSLATLLAAAPAPPRHVALLGLRGAGKSSVGAVLAGRLARAFVELDERVESATGLELGEIFQVHGEAYYREAERTALAENLAGPASVLAVGGGIVTDPESFAMLKGGARTVWLRARPEDHWTRVIAQGDTRPMADNERAFADLRRILAEREPLYRQADLVVDTSGCAVDDVVATVERQLADTVGTGG
ncbi:MAG: helix-turn-helix domain-containing protein [Planctomycetes bacterium]|nr:helix-turn-helix domain-containing protein [Planctomycetota bacterium]